MVTKSTVLIAVNNGTSTTLSHQVVAVENYLLKILYNLLDVR